MVIIILEKVPASLRGELSRWLVEPKPGIFIGHVSALVREKLWEKCCRNARGGGVIQAWSTNNEQRFAMRTYGRTKRVVMDLDGVQLPMTPHLVRQQEVSGEEEENSSEK